MKNVNRKSLYQFQLTSASLSPDKNQLNGIVFTLNFEFVSIHISRGFVSMVLVLIQMLIGGFFSTAQHFRQDSIISCVTRK